MRINLTLLFLTLLVISFFLQVRKLSLKNYLSPGLTLLCGLIVLFGVRIGNLPWGTGVAIALALLLLAASDFVFERSVENQNVFPLAIGFGVISGFIIGGTLNLLAIGAGISLALLGIFYLGALVAGLLVYRVLAVDPGLKVAVWIYVVQVVILLAGGLAAFAIGNPYLGIWGVFIFLSDSLVGIRAFPDSDRPIAWLTPERLLLAILSLYYTAQLTIVLWALWA